MLVIAVLAGAPVLLSSLTSLGPGWHWLPRSVGAEVAHLHFLEGRLGFMV